MSHSHEFLSEQADRVEESRHIEGLKRKCPCYKEEKEETKEFYNPIITRLIKLGMANKYICSTCKKNEAYPQEKCPYKLQFKDMSNTVMLPVEYAFTELLNSFKPKIIAVDDCLMRNKKHPTRKELNNTLQKMRYESGFKYDKDYTLMKLSKEENFEDIIIKFISTFDKITKSIIDQIIQFPKEPVSYTNIAPFELTNYIRLAKIHGWKDEFANSIYFSR